MTAAYPALAIDIRRHEIRGRAGRARGRVISWSQAATPRELDAEQLWRTLDALVTRVLTEADVHPATELAGVGCGCGGPMEWPRREGLAAEHPCLAGVPAARPAAGAVRRGSRCGCITTRSALRSASTGGGGSGRTTMLGIVVSTGVGGGLVLDGKLINGATGNAGHIGHVVVDPDGPPCVCGGRGCVEAIARGLSPGRLGPGRGLAARPAGGHGQGSG